MVCMVVLYGLMKKRQTATVRIRKAQLEDFLKQFNPTVFRNIAVSREVSSGAKTQPSGAGRGDVFLLRECLLIMEDESGFGLPALVLTLVAKDWRNVPDLPAEKIVLESVESKQSVLGVRIVQMLGYDAKYTHRKFSIAVYSLTPEAFHSLKRLEEWLMPIS